MKQKTEPRNEKEREGLLDVDGSREAAGKSVLCFQPLSSLAFLLYCWLLG